MKHKNQSGRSMIEMLGVLVIIGVLSVGALAGYGMAMTKYKTNQAINEIKNIIYEAMVTIEDLSTRKDIGYGLNTVEDILKQKGIFPSDDKNVIGYSIDLKYIALSNSLSLSYYLPNDGAICRNLLLAGWDQTLGSSDIKIMVGEYGSTEHTTVFSNNASETPDYPLPITIANSNTACPGGWSNTLFILSMNY